jgi:hypothetical protein
MAGLLRVMAATCFQPQRPWVVISSTDELKDFYVKVGFEDTGLVYEHPVYKGNQRIMLTRASDMLIGKSSHPIFWNAVWRPVFDHLVETGILRPEPIDRARIRVYKLMYPVAQLWFRLVLGR